MATVPMNWPPAVDGAGLGAGEAAAVAGGGERTAGGPVGMGEGPDELGPEAAPLPHAATRTALPRHASGNRTERGALTIFPLLGSGISPSRPPILPPEIG